MNTKDYPSGYRYFSKLYNIEKGAPSFNHLYDPSLTWSSNNQVFTGGFRPIFPTDLAANISLSGVSLSIGAVAVTGGQIAISNTPNVNIVNSVVPVSGNTTIINSVVPVSGNVIASYPFSTNVSTSTPSGSNGLALIGNQGRKTWFVQNHSTGGALFVRFGASASTQNYNVVLKSASDVFAADGGTFSDDGARWRGDVYCSGQNPNYIIWELT